MGGNNNYNKIVKTERKRINNVNTHVTHAVRLDTEIFFRSLFLILYRMWINGDFWKLYYNANKNTDIIMIM